MRKLRGWPLRLLGVCTALIMLTPMLWLLWRSLENGSALWWQVLRDPATGHATLRSLSLGLGIAAISMAIALPLAWWTHATDLPGRRIFRWLLVLPFAVPSYISGFVVIAVFGQAGLLPEMLARIGVGGWPDIRGGLGATLALLTCWPFVLLLLHASLRDLGPTRWEAARSLGCSPWQAFWQVVFPTLRPAALSGGLLVALYVLSDFGAVSLLHYESLSFVIYLRYRSLFDREEAVVLGLLLAAIAIAFVLLRRVLTGRQRTLLDRNAHRPWPVIPLGRWKWPAFACCTLLALWGVGLPVAVVVTWLVRGWAQSPELSPLTPIVGRTFLLGAAAGLLTLLVAYAPSVLGWKRVSALTAAIRSACHTGYALPGIVVALALVFLTIRVTPGIYQTVWVLLFAYVLRFLPLAMGALDDGLRRYAPRWTEAARTLGCSPGQAWWKVTLPNLRSAIFAGWMIVFISVIKELPATLLLSPPGWRTLATRIWSLTEDAFYGAAALPVLLLLLLSTAALMLQPGVRQRERA